MQELIVTLVVLLSAWVVARKYVPKPVRRRTAAVGARLTRCLGLARVAVWLERGLPAASSCADGCGSCGNCTPVASPGVRQFSITPDALKQTIRRS